ncbi:hypothetical protein MYX84_11080 [Acidobacteria bacterium AH-259-O06]|nr:hypothetical protein [Acidobacteria bacterium AH-259-O06]
MVSTKHTSNIVRALPGLVLRWIAAVAIGSLFFLPAAGAAIVYQVDPSNYRDVLPNLRPGDTLQLAAGTYTEGLPLWYLLGLPEAPIVITGPESGPPRFSWVGRGPIPSAYGVRAIS